MTQEEKSILLKDLCARLPYDIMGSQVLNNKIWGLPELLLNIDIQEEKVECSDSLPYGLENFRPYLRPMSNMTEEEKKIICSMNMLSDVELSDRLNYQKMYVQNYTIETFDLFNAHYLDYRGLISMGLALEAPEGMYK